MKQKNTKAQLKKAKQRSLKHGKGRYRQIIKLIPAFLFFLTAISLNGSAVSNKLPGHSGRVLSYATSMSGGELLTTTNNQRAANNIAALNINSQLNSAAQAKANDMVARNYWSHTTPDGEQPWAFISRAGYGYSTAGENLAYGFDNSDDTVSGWMNSPPHRANLLNSSFKDVGFGFANSADYVNNGQQTIVVAMYATPLSPAPTPAPITSKTSTTSQTKPALTKTAAPNSEPIQTTAAPATETQTAAAAPTETPKPAEELAAAPKIALASADQVKRIQLLAGGNARWSYTLLVVSLLGAGILWGIQKSFQLKRFITSGEHFILHHIHFDLTVFGFIALGYTLLQTIGSVR